MGSLLIIDDELDILESLQDMFLYELSADIDVYTANSARKAIQLLDKMQRNEQVDTSTSIVQNNRTLLNALSESSKNIKAK